MRFKILTVASLVALLVGVGGSATAAPSLAPAPVLKSPHPCLDGQGQAQPGFTCWTLTVPVDHSGRTPGTLDLQVGTSDNTAAPKGVLLFLTGGPGQGGVSFMQRIRDQRLPELASQYRLVMIDQRGTGALGAIDCPKLQAQVGTSDIAVGSPDAIDECSGIIGARAPFYGTDQTIGDYDSFRQALGVQKMTVDGVSYGSWTAARYAIAHPNNVNKVVLDSVLPHHATAADSLYLTGLRAQARVFRDACTTEPACGFDPAEDLAWVVRHRSTADGVRLFDATVTYEFIDPTYRNPDPIPGSGLPGDLIGALHAARGGDPAALDAIIAALNPADGTPPTAFSSGLHAATLCADQRFPWADAATPKAARQPLLNLAERRLTNRDVWPYTPQVAVNQGFIQTCLRWPVEHPNSNPAGRLPNVPVLLVNGDRDLSTPLEWARQEAALAPQGKLVIVKGAAHSIQNRELGHAGRDAVISFLTG
jgi:pimeloyl-ACP methyl ester carboxylesterase